MSIYTKKPIDVEAMVWDGVSADVIGFAASCGRDVKVDFHQKKPSLFIETLEGIHEAKVGDYIIKGIQGETYPCKPDIFESTYEKKEM